MPRGQTLCNTKRRDKAIVETSLKGVVVLLNERALETVFRYPRG